MDRHTVQFVLKEPYVWLISALAYPWSMWIIAPEVVQQHSDLEKAETAIGTGPFILERYEPNVKSVFKRNPDYYRDGQPYVDGVEWLVIPDESTGLAMYRTGQLDCGPGTSWAIRQQDLEMLKKSHPHLQYQDFQSQSASAITMRTDMPPFNDARVRRAISHAIDRQALIEAVWGRGTPSPSVSPGLAAVLCVPEFQHHHGHLAAVCEELCAQPELRLWQARCRAVARAVEAGGKSAASAAGPLRLPWHSCPRSALPGSQRSGKAPKHTGSGCGIASPRLFLPERADQATGAILPLFFQRNAEAADPGGKLYAALDRLQIDDHPMLIAHGQDSGACSNGRSPLCRRIGALKIGHLPEMVDLAGRLDPGHAHSTDLQSLYHKLVAFSLGGQCAVSPIGANTNGNGCGGD
jgi:hypothetical protein